MLRLRNNVLMKTCMSLCVVLQMALLMPHHHHDGSAAACINPVHCLADAHDHTADSGEEGCCAGDRHRHDDRSQGCAVSHVDFVLPLRDNGDYHPLPLTDVLHGFFCPCSLLTGKSGMEYAQNISRTDLRINRGAQRLHTHYIPRALPARAPSA